MQVNMPLLEVIKQVPKYARFLKELCTYKRGLRQPYIKMVSTLSKNEIPKKCGDPGQFTMPCIIRKITIFMP